MQEIEALWKNGEVVLKDRPDWPEGSRLTVAAKAPANDDDRDDDAESIARWIAEFDAIPPLEMTPQEEADWQAARQAQHQLERTTSAGRNERLQRKLG
jgi:hypothetical protein